MRVSVDEAVCVGSGQCELLCPEVFEVGEVARVLVPEPDSILHDSVREAARACPTQAIIVEEL